MKQKLRISQQEQFGDFHSHYVKAVDAPPRSACHLVQPRILPDR